MLIRRRLLLAIPVVATIFYIFSSLGKEATLEYLRKTKLSSSSSSNNTDINSTNLYAGVNMTMCSPLLPKYLEHCKTNKAAPKYPLVFQCRNGDGLLCGGVGDRFRGFSFIRFLALRACVPFLSDWDFTSVWITRNKLWQYKSKNESVQRHRWFTLFKVPLSVVFEGSQHPIKTTIIQSNMDPETFFSGLGLPSVQLHYRQIAGCLFHMTYKPSDAFSKMISAEKKAVANAMKINNCTTSIGLHFRMGDAMSDVRNQRGKGIDKRQSMADISKMFECARTLQNRLGLKRTLFLFVSDSLEAKQAAEKLENVYVTSIKPKHVERRRLETNQMQISSWLELILLSYTNGIVLSKGGYGKVAASLGLMGEKQILKCF